MEPKIAVNKFPLLKAPWLVIQNVITCMTPYEALHLSLCSKRLQALTAYFTRRQRYHLHFTAEKVLEVSLELPNSHDSFVFKFSNNVLCLYLGYKSAWHKGKHRPHLSDQLHVVKSLLADLTCLYSISFSIAELHLDHWEYSNPELLYNWLNSFGNNIQHARIYGDAISSVGYQKFLENFHFSKTACMHVSRKSDNLPEMFCEDLHMDPACWLTLDDLLNMKNCVTARLDDVGLSDESLNAFLKCVIRGHLPKLEYIKMSLGRGYDGDKIIKGIEMFHEDSGRVFRRHFIEQLDEGGHYFQLDSGEIATIFFYPEEEEEEDMEPDSIGVVVWRRDSIHH